MTPDFIVHPAHGIGALTPGQKLRIIRIMRGQTVTLFRFPMQRDDDMPPPAAPALPMPQRRAA